jgi:hypothetical protein
VSRSAERQLEDEYPLSLLLPLSSKTAPRAANSAKGTALFDEHGIGPTVVATILTQIGVGDPFRFAPESKFALW